MTSIVDWVGAAAASCTTLSFVPQVVKVWRSRSGADISGQMYTVFITGMGLWLLYGLLVHAWPIIIANGVTILLAAAVLALKFRFAK